MSKKLKSKKGQQVAQPKTANQDAWVPGSIFFSDNKATVTPWIAKGHIPMPVSCVSYNGVTIDKMPPAVLIVLLERCAVHLCSLPINPEPGFELHTVKKPKGAMHHGRIITDSWLDVRAEIAPPAIEA